METLFKENHKKYLQRVIFYKGFGYDIEENREFLINAAKPINGKILEIGTGKGYLTLALAKQGYQFTSVDISFEEQEFAKLNLQFFELEHLVNFQIADALNLNFYDKSFDVIFSVNTLHHIDEPFRFIAEAIRVMKDKGKRILSDFSEEGLNLINMVHEKEGKKHKEGKIRFSEIETFLAKNRMQYKKDGNRYQDVFIIYK